MTARPRTLASTMSLLAGFVAALIVLGAPTVYFTLALAYQRGSLDAEAQVSARTVGQLVSVNPRMWTFQQVRLAELLERRAAPGVPEVRRVLDRTGAPVAGSADPLDPPLLTRRQPILDAGEEVGTVEVSRSLRPLLLETAGVLVLALALAGAIVVALRLLPVRAVAAAQAALEASERRYRSLYDSMNEGLALLRLVRDGGGRAVSFSVVDANPACARLLGVDAAALAGADGASLLGGALLPHLPALVGALERHEPHTFEATVPGSRTLRVSVFSPEPGHFATLLEDVTARKRAEEERERLREHLVQAQKLESVGRLAGGVAHDFNNILTVILSYARELASGVQGEPHEQALEIERAAQRAAAITRQLLAFGRQQVLRPERLDAGEVVANVANLVGRLLGERIALAIRVAPGVGAIRMDPTQLEQVIVNLAANARDAMPDGGTLSLDVRDEEVPPGATQPPGLAPGAYVALSVSDTGTGMDAETRSRIFEPFFTTKPLGKGTGLGLAMVLGAVEQSGGHVAVETAPGRGTTFTLRLPRLPPVEDDLDEAGGEAEALPAGGAGGRAPHVLVVDDEPPVCAAVGLHLRAGGYRVTEATGGEEALAAFRADASIAAVLTDVAMPGLDGLALGEAIRAVRGVPVLYMSGYSEEVVSGRGDVPPEHFLEKPIVREQVLARLAAVLGPAARSTAA